MASLNLVQLIGRLGRDVELRYSQGGNPIANMTVATDESYTDRDGNRVDRTEWHRVVAYGRTAENCANYLAKGSLVYIEGSLQTRKWTDQNGAERYTTEIKAQRVQFLDRKGEGGGQGNQQAEPRQNTGRRQGQRQRRPKDEDLGPAFPQEQDDSGVPF